MAWYALACASSFEDKIAKRLGAAAYIPKRTIWKKIRKRGDRSGRQRRQYPLIPGYILVQSIENLQSILGFFDHGRIYGYVSFGNSGPLKIKDAEIEYLKQREQCGHYDETKAIFAALLGGLFDIHEGMLSGKRVRVLDIKNRMLVMSVDDSKRSIVIPVVSFEKTRHTRIG